MLGELLAWAAMKKYLLQVGGARSLDKQEGFVNQVNIIIFIFLFHKKSYGYKQ